MSRELIEFASEGRTIRGWLYLPDGAQEPVPAIVMAHGFSAVKEQYLDRYADVFGASGLAVIVFDNPNFGDSDGLPRQEVDPVLQRRAYRDAITFAQTVEAIDGSRIGIWGSSYSGGHVIQLGAIDRRVKCVVSQVPIISGYQSSLRQTKAGRMAVLEERFAVDRLARFLGEPPAMIQAVEEMPKKAAAMVGQPARDFFLGTLDFAPNWKNEVTLRSAEMSRENEPGSYIARISPTPLLMIVARDDDVTAADLSLEAYNRALEPKKLVLLPGDHFMPYLKHFEKSSAEARDWFVMHLLEG